uniref:Rab-GAP TBC domain-containing protein n=1 Tax=Eutreptiella gymnastica TaxID=73025 RepID=A0A7S1ISC6_9EUGL|mmetsp:Transcript_39850/g.71368  ORF Transcript_39850/g.71368 Transcript_39850/m.71368 type:complete len:425 (+) Transcript_39850:78-1352(+)
MLTRQPSAAALSLGDGWATRSLGGEGDQDFDVSDGSLWKYVAANFTVQERKKMRITFHGVTSSVKEQFFEYLCNNWRGFTMHHADKVVHCVRQGVPDRCRGVIWQHMVDSKGRQLRFPGLYAKLKHFPSGNEKQIRRDLHRTFPGDPLFQERDGPGQQGLFNVLNAHASFDTRTGYMQGMAFVVGFLLRYVDEESAFWMFVSLMQDNLYNLRLLYGPGVGGFLMMMYQVDCLVEQYLPAIAQHLASSDPPFTANVYAPPFIPSLFIGRMPRESGARILDIFLSEGDSIIPRLFLGLLKFNEEQILSNGPEQILTTLNTSCETIDMQQLLHLAFTFPVTHVMLENLEREYWEKLQAEKAAERVAAAEAERQAQAEAECEGQRSSSFSTTSPTSVPTSVVRMSPTSRGSPLTFSPSSPSSRGSPRS